MTSGSALVSTIATTGIPRRRASFTAFCSRKVSITTSVSGSSDMSRIPSRLRLCFAADKQNPAAATRDLLQEISCTPELPHSFIKIDNVNLVALFKDEGLHLGIPTLRLVSKMNTSLQQFRH